MYVRVTTGMFFISGMKVEEGHRELWNMTIVSIEILGAFRIP